MTFLKTAFFASAAFLVPVVASAQFGGGWPGNIGQPVAGGAAGTGRLHQLLQSVHSLLQAIIPIILGLALIVFLWGVLVYVISKSQDEKEKARGFMIWGIIGLFVMVSVWGLVNVLSEAVFGQNQATIQAPIATPKVPLN